MAMQDIKPGTGHVYRDEYIVEQDQMGDSGTQETLIYYIKQVLLWLYHLEQWMITANRNHYHSALDNSEKLIVPDIAVFKGIPIPPEEQPYITSWDMRQGDKPAPPLVIEVSSASTYRGDIELDKKPRLYGLIGVREYFAYDPNRPQVWPRRYATRLLGWRYDQAGQPHSIEPDERGWLWSEVLECWLGADGLYLRFYDQQGRRLLTQNEAMELAYRQEEQARKQEEQARIRETEARKQEELARKLEAEARLREEQARLQAEQRAQAEIEARKQEEQARKQEEQARLQAEQRAETEAEARQQAERELAELKRQYEELKRQQQQP